MQFLADVELICESARARGTRRRLLEVRYAGRIFTKVLNLTVKEALKFFAKCLRLPRKLRVLDEVGPGIPAAGAIGDNVIRGEAQRMKLAAHLQPAAREIGRPAPEGTKNRAGGGVYCTFLMSLRRIALDDVSKLLAAFRRLIEAGGSILVIEHNLEVIKTADWVIDLGPEGGRGAARLWARHAGDDRESAGLLYWTVSGSGVEGAGVQRKRRVPMAASKFLAGVLLASAVCQCAVCAGWARFRRGLRRLRLPLHLLPLRERIERSITFRFG